MAEDFLNYRVPKQVADIVVGAAQLDRALAAGTVQPAEPERINGTLRFTKIGSIMYYKLEDINKILEGNGR